MSVQKENAHITLTETLENRWSPRAFSSKSITQEEAMHIFEAMRWSPSCMNEQPWRIIYALKEDQEGFERLFSCLLAGNAWAKNAALLFLISSEENFSTNGQKNDYAGHDVGIALGQMLTQLTAMGLHAHLMAGFDIEKTKTVLNLPSSQKPWTIVAVGELGDPQSLSEALQQRELKTRQRKTLDSLIFQLKS